MLRLKSWGNRFGTFSWGILRLSHLYVFRAKKQIKIVYAGQKHTRKVTHFCQSTQHFDEKKNLNSAWSPFQIPNNGINFYCERIKNHGIHSTVWLFAKSTETVSKFSLWENHRITHRQYTKRKQNFWENSRQYFCRVAMKNLLLLFNSLLLRQ